MRTFLIALGLLGCAPAWASGFVQVQGAGFALDGKPYAFLGANLWSAMNLASTGHGGDRARLVRELDRLAALGVRNLRILGASEGPDTQPWRLAPALQSTPGSFDTDQLEGLGWLFARMHERGMKAVVILNNFWPWSGGMAQYLAWNGAGAIPYPPPAQGGSWDGFQSYAARFYSNPGAVSMANAAIRAVVPRFRDEPAVMAWELANEPRGDSNRAAFLKWIAETSALIKSLDPNHLVTTGCEGETPWPGRNGLDLKEDSSPATIDYATAHVWAQNWGWYDPGSPGASFDSAVGEMRSYLDDEAARAKALGKPLVIEEFGLARDGGSFAPSSATSYRDRYFAALFGRALAARRAGAPVAGVNFWAWAGEAVPTLPGGYWRVGEPFLGDPPHERQGWYSVYAGDASTLKIIKEYARKFAWE